MSKIKRTPAEWREIAERINAGPTPGGNKLNIYTSGQYAAGLIAEFTGGVDGLRIAEMGCGNGRIAMGLTDYPILEYSGVEIIGKCVEFCKSAFAGIDGYHFQHCDIKNERYNGAGVIADDKAAYPLEDNHYDLVLLMSIVTHISSRSAVRHIISEARRALVPGGRMLITWFKSPPYDPSDDLARVVFPEAEIYGFLAGWEILREGSPDGVQWYILAQK